MKLLCPCPACGTQFRVDEKFAGRKTRCPACAADIIVPQIAAAEMVDEPQPPAASTAGASAAGASAAAGAAGAAAPNRSAPSAGAGGAARRPQIPVASPVVRKVAPQAAAPAEPAEEDLFASIVGGPPAAVPAAARLSSGSRSLKPKPKAKNTWQNPSTWIALGCVAVALIVVGVLVAMNSGGPAPVAKAPPKAEAPKAPSLVLELSPQDRADAWIKIDGNSCTIPSFGPIEFGGLAAGSHTVEIHRMTGAHYEFTYDAQKNPGRYVVKPDWNAAGQEATLATNSAAAGNPGQAGSQAGGMAQWLSDPEKAKFQAAHDKKDLLVALFTTSAEEHADWCSDMKAKVFAKPEFTDFAAKHLVTLILECDKTPPEGSPMAKLAAQYHVSSFPAVMLLDDQGEVLCWDENFHARGLYDTLNWVNGAREERDRRFAAAEKGTDAEKLAEARKALDWLNQKNLALFYVSKIHDWKVLAEKVDPKDEQGLLEAFLFGELEARLQEVPKTDGKKIVAAMEPLLAWIKEGPKFKDADAAARFNLKVGEMLAKEAKDIPDAVQFILHADECHPTNVDLKNKLAIAKQLFTQPYANGTGWICAPGGYIMTNNHVVEGEGGRPAKIWVKIRDKDYPCDVLAHGDTGENDLALIRLRDPSLVANLKPLILRPGLAHRGLAVAAFGYPLSDSTGSELKFTQGAISAMPSKERYQMYLLDIVINPGNSGGPLVDMQGRVLGLNTRKSSSGGEFSSYGLAIPADRAIKFLKENLKEYKPPPPGDIGKDGRWDQVDQQISPSVVMVLQKYI